MSLNDDVMERMKAEGYGGAFNDAFKQFIQDGAKDGHTPEPVWSEDKTSLAWKVGDRTTDFVRVKGEDGEDGKDAEVPATEQMGPAVTYLLGSETPMQNRINVFCPNLTMDTSGLISLYVTSTGNSGAKPKFKDLNQCAIASTVFSINGGIANNEVPIIAVRDYNNTTGLLRLVAKKARGSIVLSSSAFTEGGNVRFNVTISGEENI